LGKALWGWRGRGGSGWGYLDAIVTGRLYCETPKMFHQVKHGPPPHPPLKNSKNPERNLKVLKSPKVRRIKKEVPSAKTGIIVSFASALDASINAEKID